MAVTLVRKQEEKHFRTLLAEIARGSRRVDPLPIENTALEPHIPRYAACLECLKRVLSDEARGQVDPLKPLPRESHVDAETLLKHSSCPVADSCSEPAKTVLGKGNGALMLGDLAEGASPAEGSEDEDAE
jgi:hypothetical protein